MIILGVSSLIIYALFFDESRKVYSFDHLHYDVEMLPNGDALVSEERTYSYKKGDYTRGYFELEEGIEDIIVLENGKPYELIPDFDSSRPKGKYAYKNEDGLIRLEWYIDVSGGEKRTFQIKYKVKKATILYNDCAIYFQKFLSEKNTTKIKKLTATIKLVPGANSDNTLIWGHGPSHGNLEFDEHDSSKVNFVLKNVTTKHYVEARFLLGRELMPNGLYIENQDMREYVIEEETSAGKEADRDRRISAFSSLAAYIITAILILFPIILRIKKREHFTRYRPELQPEYYRDIPENIPPAILDCLYNYYGKGGKVSKQISGTIVDMIYRGVLATVRQQNGRKIETYLKLTKDKYKSNELTSFERTLMDFFFGEIGKGQNMVSITEIKKYCKKKKNVTSTSKMLDSFSTKVRNMWNKYDYEEKTKNKVPGAFKVLLFISLGITIGCFILFIRDTIYQATGAFFVLTMGGLISFIINLIVSKKKKMLNQKGENFLALWKGFYNFLNHFTLFDEKELPELFMWEKYLVYATVLGIADKVIKQLKLKYPQLNDTRFVEENLMFMTAMNIWDMNGIGGLAEIEQGIQSAVIDAQNIISNLRSSSSSGSGGGFSSGGSSGGGGAGGTTGGGMD